MTLIGVYTVTHPGGRKGSEGCAAASAGDIKKATKERSNYGKLEKQHSCRVGLKLWLRDREFPQPPDSRAGISQTSGELLSGSDMGQGDGG